MGTKVTANTDTKPKTPEPRGSYDVVIIGAGAAGSVAAQVLAHAGKTVAIIERDKLGGRYTSHTSVPLRTLSHLSKTLNQARRARSQGLKTAAIGYSWPTIIKSAEAAAEELSATIQPGRYREKGIDLLRGEVNFISDHEVSVGRHRIKAKKFLIASGASEFVPSVMGLKEAGFTTVGELLAQRSFPKQLAIIGGGQTAVELATIAQTFGSQVTIIERKKRLLPGLDHSIGKLINALYTRREIDIITDAHRMRADKSGRRKVIAITNTKDQTQEVAVDEIVIAAGMRSNLDLGLPNAGVLYNESGIVVNQQLQTNIKNIWAAGDVLGEPRYVHVAAYQGRVAAHNMLHRVKTDFPKKAIPAVIFADPEIAVVGESEDALHKRGAKYKVVAARLSEVARSITDDAESGFVKIMVAPRGRILGAAIVGPCAGEMIHELSLAISANVHIDAVATAMHAFPSWSEAIRLAASKF